MRPKVIVVVLLTALLTVAGLIHFGNTTRKQTSKPEPLRAAVSEGGHVETTPETGAEPRPSWRPTPDAGASDQPTNSPGARESAELPSRTTPLTSEQIDEKVAELEAVAESGEEGVILAVTREFMHPARAVRLAAARVARELGDREAIPFLEAAAAATEDTQEKAAYLEAVEFLKLPTLTEWRNRR